MRFQRLSLLALLIPVGALVALCLPGLSRDLWWDEFTSLDGFALKSYATTVTDYSQVNNHIVFNLVLNTATRVFGHRDIYAWLDRIALLRGTALGLACLTVVFTYALGRRFLDSRVGLLAAVVLATSIPYVNSATQLRGYALSALFTAGTLYFAWGYARDRRRRDWAGLCLAGFLLLYTIPSNAYFLAGLGLLGAALGVRAATGGRRSEPAGPSLRTVILLLAALGAAAALAVLAYLPVLEPMLSNPILHRRPEERTFVLFDVLPAVMDHFVSFRYGLLLLSVAGLLGLGRARRGATTVRATTAGMVVLLVLPFALAFARNDLPFQRSFLPLLPVFALAVAAPAAAFLGNLRLGRRGELLAVGLVAAYCVGTGIWQTGAVQRTLDRNLERDIRAQNIYENYYLADNYAPGASVAVLAEHQRGNPGPTILVQPFDRVSLPFYLKKHGLKGYRFQEMRRSGAAGVPDTCLVEVSNEVRGEIRSLPVRILIDASRIPDEVVEFGPVLELTETMEGGSTFYVITPFATTFETMFAKHYARRYTIQKLTRGPQSSTVYLLTRRSG